MGFSLSWAAVRGKLIDTVLSELGLVRTDETEEFPESPFTLAELPDGWRLIAANRDVNGFSGMQMTGLSLGGEVVTCAVEQRVMYSAASGWRNGSRIWQVDHDAQQNLLHLRHSGTLPVQFEEIRRRFLKEQAAEDEAGEEVDCIFEIPVELARALTGFRFDRPDEVVNTFTVLAKAPPQNENWLSRLKPAIKRRN